MAKLEESKIKFKVSQNLRNTSFVLIGIGVLLIILQVIFPWHSSHEAAKAVGGNHNTRLWMSLHLALLVVLPLGVGSLFFVTFNHLAGSAWSITVRRLAEQHVWYMPFLIILMAVILFFGLGDVFHHWVHASPDDELINHKSAWLSKNFFIIRNLAFAIIWFLLGYILLKKSIKQDSDSKFEHTVFMARLSAFAIVVFGLTYSANSWDLSLSLEPHWFSTMWAVYTFSGMILTILAALILWVWYLKKSGYYGESVNENHVHDLGKYLWGFTIFWAYIGISQFLLIWYAHIPEETIFYNKRMYNNDMTYNAWGYVSLLLLMVRFILPFFLIIKRESKRKLGYLASISVLIIFGQILDMYWIAYPTMDHGHFIAFNWYEIGPLSLVAGVYIFTIATALSKNSMIPTKDPRLEKCLHWHQ